VVKLPPRVVVAGTASGVGKTTVATGLMAALRERGLAVAGAKVGPDFIDPGWHALAAGRPGRNLDAFLCGPELIAPLAAHGAAGGDVLVVEGVMGLFDGAVESEHRPMGRSGVRGLEGRGELASTAQVAKLLDAPVLLVVDAAKVGRSVAATVHGFATFDPSLRLAGVVANRVGSERHEQIVAEALAPLGVPLVGVLRRDAVPELPSRHLGLVTAREQGAEAAGAVAAIGQAVAGALDLDRVLGLARSAPPTVVRPWSPRPPRPAGRVAVAVAGGPAFTFTYAEHLELLAAEGAEVAWFDPAADERLPEGTAALYLPGGFPEVHGEALAANERLRAEVAAFAAAGGPVMAECGGLLYLCRTLDGRPMCGVLAADASMGPRLTVGYRRAAADAESVPFAAGARVRAHEFHHARVTPGAGATAAWSLQDGGREGFIASANGSPAGTAGLPAFGTVHASFLHSHWAAAPSVAARLVAAARRVAA
jgi:cobyrinic acid a,c-diamide synthase